jgi:hypothetical protein
MDKRVTSSNAKNQIVPAFLRQFLCIASRGQRGRIHRGLVKFFHARFLYERVNPA